MKKYKLKKDLPLAKVGDLVYVMKNIYEYLEEYQDKRTGKVLGSIDFKDFGEWLEEIEEKVKSVWDLKVGDFYFCILESGEVERFDILDEILFETYKKDLEIGNVFITEEEAEKEIEKRKAIIKIKEYCWENGVETEHKINNDLGFILSPLGIVTFQSLRRNGNPIGYFSEEDAEKILNNFEKELKIILDV